MGKVVGKIRVTNFRDTSKSVEIEAVIDMCATMSALPVDLIQELGLEKIDEVNVRYEDNSVRRKEVYGWIILEIASRKAVFDVLAENEGAQPLIGQIVLERLDLIIEPTTRKVMPNPRSPETPMIEIFMASSLSKRRYGCGASQLRTNPFGISHTCKKLRDIAGNGFEEVKK